MNRRILRKRLAGLKVNLLLQKKSGLAKLAEEQFKKVGSLGQELVLMQMNR